MKPQEALKQELLALEQQYWTAIKQRDAGTAARLSEDPCLVVGAQGVGELKLEALTSMMEKANYDLHAFTITDVHVRALDDETAVLAYTVEEKLTVEGEPIALKAFDSSVWIKRNGRWACVLHTESLAGDAFGRQ